MIGTFLKQLTKNVSSLPGWVSLIVFGYACLYAHPVLSNLPRDYQALIVIVLAYIFYQLGDAIDKAVFTKLEPKFVSGPRDRARKHLEIHDGVYAISKALSDSAGLYSFSAAQFCNEFSKFLRSFCVAALVMVVALALIGQYLITSCFLVVTLTSGVGYIFLKALHMKLLYENVEILELCKSRYASHPLDEHIVLFFWDGVLIGSGRKKVNA